MVAVNNPAVVAAVSAAHDEYEAAFLANDVDALARLFWSSEHAVRIGFNEALYGTDEITAFRQRRVAADLGRTNVRKHVVTFGDDTGITTLEYVRVVSGVERRGRQTQVWRRLDDGWRIVSAHVSYTDAGVYLTQAAEMVGTAVPADVRASVQGYLTRTKALADVFMDFPLPEDLEAAPVFRP